jgi:hypothetical protein
MAIVTRLTAVKNSASDRMQLPSALSAAAWTLGMRECTRAPAGAVAPGARMYRMQLSALLWCDGLRRHLIRQLELPSRTLALPLPASLQATLLPGTGPFRWTTAGSRPETPTASLCRTPQNSRRRTPSKPLSPTSRPDASRCRTAASAASSLACTVMPARPLVRGGPGAWAMRRQMPRLMRAGACSVAVVSITAR